MIDDVPEAGRFFVTTPHGGTPVAGELEDVARQTFLRAFMAREICPQIGGCLIKVEHLEEGGEDGIFDVHEFKLACDTEDCPLLSEKFS